LAISPSRANDAAKLTISLSEFVHTITTEAYASAFGSPQQESAAAQYEATAARARELHIGVNAGHDLDLRNLSRFLQIPGISEVSIGHALIVESLEQGLASVIRQYLVITGERS